MKRLVLAVAILSLLSISQAAQASPNLINYQGYLKNSGGNPIDTTINMTFRLYDTDGNPAPGNLLWSETQSIAISDGVYNVQLGAITDLAPLDFAIPYWLTVEIETDGEMTPRQPLSSVGYAIRAETADGVADNDGDELSNLQEFNPDALDEQSLIAQINFGVSPVVWGKATNPNLSDTDGDGLRDDWERTFGLDPLVKDAGEDPDGDQKSQP